jgi:hypothetical protein
MAYFVTRKICNNRNLQASLELFSLFISMSSSSFDDDESESTSNAIEAKQGMIRFYRD